MARISQVFVQASSAAGVVLVAVLGVILAGGCGSEMRRSGVLLRGLENPQAYAAGGALYVAQQVTPPGSTVLSEVMRVAPGSGAVQASRRLAGAFDQALLAGGSLWVTSTRGAGSWLWRLAPRSLAVRSRELLAGSSQNDGIAGTMALAGGWLWVGAGDRLDRISPASGRATATVPVPGVTGVDVAADASGRVLIVSEGHVRARVQRRDPASGTLMAQSPVFLGVTKPYLGGVFGGGVWISSPGGMMGAVQRLSVATLRPGSFAGDQPHPGITGPPSISGTNGIRAQLIDGILWVTQPYGGSRRNYCGDPLTGRPRAAPALPAGASLLTADATSIYYITGSASPVHAELARAPLDPRCVSGP